MSRNIIVTHSGIEYDLDRPRPEQVSALDIAHSLANINRFTGHTTRPYSVAEHSMVVLGLMQSEYGISNPKALLATLLHDGHEAYVGDQSTPAKDAIGPAWRNFEDPHEANVLRRFNVYEAARDWRSLIKTCDRMALAIEARDLMPQAKAGSTVWACVAGLVPPASVNLNIGHHAEFKWQDWRDVFLETFGELHFAVHGDGQLQVAA